MTIDELMAEIEKLSPGDLQTLKARLDALKTPGELWMERFDAAMEKFWGDTDPAEREAIVEAIRYKDKYPFKLPEKG